MGKTSYKNTAELIKSLSAKINQLHNGEMSLEEINTLVDYGKDLYEHLIVLRYKAFDQYGEPASNAEPVAVIEKFDKSDPNEQIVNAEVEETMFDFSAMNEETDSIVKEEVETKTPSFDFSMSEDTSEIENEIKKVEELKLDPIHPLLEEDETNSLHDVLKTEDDTSLRKKLQNSSVSNIKEHISIAKKFEYISIMFNGDAEAYADAIDFLNTSATGKDAQLKLNEYTTNYNWDLENKSIINFIELVERRYLEI